MFSAVTLHFNNTKYRGFHKLWVKIKVSLEFDVLSKASTAAAWAKICTF